MTSVSEPTPTRLVLLTYSGEPSELFETNATTHIKRFLEASSGTATSAHAAASWKNFNEVVYQFTKGVEATEGWLDTYENVLRRIDQHSSAVASKSLFTDKISQYLNAEQDVFQSFSELAITLLRQPYEPMGDVVSSYGSSSEEEDSELEATLGSYYLEMVRYEAVLGETLVSNGFEKSDAYLDPKGGLVVDYFRNSDRITLIFSDESVQLLTHVSGQFLNRIFSPVQTSQIEVLDFLDGLLLGTK